MEAGDTFLTPLRGITVLRTAACSPVPRPRTRRSRRVRERPRRTRWRTASPTTSWANPTRSSGKTRARFAQLSVTCRAVVSQLLFASCFLSWKLGAGREAPENRSSGQQAAGVGTAESAVFSEQPGPQPSLRAGPAPPRQRAAAEQVGARGRWHHRVTQPVASSQQGRETLRRCGHKKLEDYSSSLNRVSTEGAHCYI